MTELFNGGLPLGLRPAMTHPNSNLAATTPEWERIAIGFLGTIRSMEEHDFEVRKAALVERARLERGDKFAEGVACITWFDVQTMAKLRERAKDLGLIKR